MLALICTHSTRLMHFSFIFHVATKSFSSHFLVSDRSHHHRMRQLFRVLCSILRFTVTAAHFSFRSASRARALALGDAGGRERQTVGDFCVCARTLSRDREKWKRTAKTERIVHDHRSHLWLCAGILSFALLSKRAREKRVLWPDYTPNGNWKLRSVFVDAVQ